jgi:3D (Asp-Asp-Asp) domain-containing protein
MFTQMRCLLGMFVLLFPAISFGERAMPGRFVLTQYWVAEESQIVSDGRAVRLLTLRDQPITWTTQRFMSALSMEGTGRTWDGRLLNWAGRANGHPSFHEVDTAEYPFGTGVMGYALVPFRSLAVDSRYVPLGHTVELPELRGVQLPDGSLHDGCFVAVDGGGAIRGHHIDLFVPSRVHYEALASQNSLPRRVSVILDSRRCELAIRYAIFPSPDHMPADPYVVQLL